MTPGFFNVPNLISLGRIASLPGLALLIHHNQLPWACVLLTLIGISDVLDGYFARKLNLITSEGKILDPIADKLVLTIGVIFLGAKEPLSPVHISPLLATLLLSREFMIAGLRSVAASHGLVFGASAMAKWKTIAQFVGLGFILGYHDKTAWLYPDRIGGAILWLSVILSYVSMARYFMTVRQHMKKHPRPHQAMDDGDH